ncbi:hypothetical protein, partial [Streptomyces cacaoi]|uniref:hypothetical protein n=1 Tax=Streptomyces cacaoi TaxID=1898 RepID=UPI00332B2A80
GLPQELEDVGVGGVFDAEALRAAHGQAGHENAAAAKRRRAAEAAQRRALARAKARAPHCRR